MSYLSTGRGAGGARPDGLPAQPHPRAHCGEVCIGTNNTKCTTRVFYLMNIRFRTEIRNKLIRALEKNPFYHFHRSCRQWRKAENKGLSQCCFINETENHWLEGVSIMNPSFTPDPRQTLQLSTVPALMAATTLVKDVKVDQGWGDVFSQ